MKATPDYKRLARRTNANRLFDKILRELAVIFIIIPITGFSAWLCCVKGLNGFLLEQDIIEATLEQVHALPEKTLASNAQIISEWERIENEVRQRRLDQGRLYSEETGIPVDW